MVPAVTYAQVIERLAERFKTGRYPPGSSAYVRMTGILFAPPTSQLGAKEIVPNLNRFHLHSGANIDFFCVGYAMGSAVPSWNTDYNTLPPVEGSTWSYSDSAFEAFRKTMQGETTWRYAGGCDLILVNAKWNQSEVSLEIEQAVDLKLDEMLQIGAITSVETLFARIFQWAESASGKDGTWGFSDKEGVRSLKQLVLSLLPLRLGAEARKAAFFAVRDLQRAA